ncbi:MAG: molybdenum cofactor biosynthesis protein MoaE [Bowdeniella nasicola]|nr:molybdenum cofactor biosynthesis protein MoaE [Bowdeniella nasicola]
MSLSRVRAAAVQSDPIDVAALRRAVDDPRAGALTIFEGVVRNHDGGREVTHIEYSAHPAAAQLVRDVACDVAERFDVHGLALVHRIGELGIGDRALVAVVATSHRAEGFAAIAAAVDEVKARLPVWKLQHFADGTEEWSNCP